MKKGVVFQIDGTKALILENGGKISRVNARKGWAIGDVVSVSACPENSNIRFWVPHAAGILLMLFALQFGYNHYFSQPVTYVSVDVNPSLEIGVNRLDQVIDSKSYNADGGRILETLDIVGMPYDEAVETLMESKEMQPYLAEDPNVIFAVCCSDASRQAELLYGLYGVGQRLGEARSEGLSVLCSSVAWELLEKAHALGLTPGRLALFEQMEGEGGDLDIEAFISGTVSSLLDRMKGI